MSISHKKSPFNIHKEQGKDTHFFNQLIKNS
jgi:hypothetical protein